MRISRILKIVSILVLLNSPLVCHAGTSTKKRIFYSPDLMQTAKKADLPYGGNPYCGPVAASNTMVYLANSGYPKLSKWKVPDEKKQGLIAKELAGRMNTTKKRGTNVAGFIAGIESYIESRGYSIDSLKYQGWQRCKPKYFTGNKKPSLALTVKQMKDLSAVWIKIGWYRYFPATKEYKRFAGHWVEVLDVKEKIPGKVMSLLIHDSSSRSGRTKTEELVTAERLNQGVIQSDWVKPFDAQGMWKLSGQLKIKRKADVGILDGIVTLKLPKITTK